MPAPVPQEGASLISTYFPGGPNEYWYDIETSIVRIGGDYHDIDVDMDSMPYYYRGGSIIFRIDEDVRCTAEQHDFDYQMYVFLDSNFEATGNLYQDDFESFEYRNQVYEYYRFKYDAEEGIIVEEINENARFYRGVEISRVHVYSPAASYSNEKVMQTNVKVFHKKISIKNLESKITIEL